MSVRMARLGDVCEVNPRIPKGISDNTLVSFLPMSAISEDGYVAFEEARAYGEVKKGYTYFERGDVLIAKITPCFENGKAACTTAIQNQLGFGSTEFHVVRPSPGVDAKYIFYFLWSARFRTVGEKGMTGSAGQKRVPADLLRRLEIPLPPLDEQKRIAAILDKADAQRRKRRQALALLDSLTQSIFLEMFGDPVSNPKGWEDDLLLANAAEIGSGVTKGRSTRGQQTRSVPYLAVANVQDRSLDLRAVKEIEATESEIQKYRLMKGDILVTEGGDPDKLGRGTIWNDEIPEAIHQNHIFKIRIFSDRVSPLFVNWLMGSARGKRYFLQSAKQTTGIASINKTQLSKFPLLVPPIELQIEFADRVATIAELKTKLESSKANVASLFASLQHRAFTGQL
ncbi:restriction endonuclease subunit S [Xanthobacter sp. TB0139]|uniref:restriction endonuclease subunit S n=1 Tax=Xanthobacter sp. TB0139 TaxID=3459178 RepID=UPI00403A2169